MRKNFLLAFLIIALFIGTAVVIWEPGEGQTINKFNGNNGFESDYVTLKGGGQNLYDSHLYIELEKNVPLSEASMKISTVNSENGPWITEPAVDVGVDGNPDWSFQGTGYGDFGRNTVFFDDSESKTNAYSTNQNKLLTNVKVPVDAEVHQAGMTIRGRFEAKIPSIETMAEGGGISYGTQYIRIGEVTGDNVNDTILSTGRPGTLYLYKQIANREFESSTIPSITSSVYDYLIYDANDDGRNDIVYADTTGIHWTRNNGMGFFSSKMTITTSVTPYLMELADMDGDGEDEIITAARSFSWSVNQTSIHMLKRSTGSNFDIWPLYNTGSGSGTTSIKFLKVGDWNNDDYIDVFGAFSNNRVHTFQNPAYSWYYDDVSNISTKTRWSRRQALAESYTIGGFDVGDVDDDGDADIVIAPTTYYGSNIHYWRNRGNSWTRYRIMSGYIYYPRSVALADLDSDGYLDVFYSVGNYYYNNRVGWLDSGGNPNRNYWTDNQLLSGQTDFGINCYSGDIDSDGYEDVGLFFTPNKQAVSWFNSKPYDGTSITPGFIEAGGLVAFSDLEKCDVDQDGDDDFLITAYKSGSVGWFENDGTPFADKWNFNRINGVMVSGAKEVAWGDIDGDGDFDVAVSAYDSGRIYWFENPKVPTGNPKSLWEFHYVGQMTYAYGVGVADLDEDGIMEIVASPGYYQQYPIRMYYTNDPDGAWKTHSISSSVSYCGVINMTDMNNDGHIDVIVPINGWSGSAQIYRNPMPSNPTTSSWASISGVSGLSYPQEAVPVDINNDGNLDLVATSNYGSVKWGKAPPNANSTGGWQSYAIGTVSYGWGVEVDDVDKDGFADVFVSSKYRWDYYISSARGLYWFEEPDDNTLSWQKRTLDPSIRYSYGVAVSDLDGNGVTEIFTVSYYDHHMKVSRPQLDYPSDVVIDLGNDGISDWAWTGKLRGTTQVEFTPEIQYVIDSQPTGTSVTTDDYGNKIMSIPIYLRTGTRGRLTGSGFEVRYNVTFDIDNRGQLLNEISRIIPDYDDPINPNLRIYITFSGKSEGTALISDIMLEYNAPPKSKAALPTTLTVNEDSIKRSVLDLSKFFTDDYDPPHMLNYKARMVGPNSDKVNVYIENGANVTIDSTLTKDFDRDTYVEFVVKDNGGPGGVPARQKVSNRIKIDVLPVDDPPVLGNDTLPSKLEGFEGEEIMAADLNGLVLFQDPDDPLGLGIRYFAILDFEKNYPQDLSQVSVRLKDKKVYVKSEGDWYGLNIPLRIYGYDKQQVNLLGDPYHTTIINIMNVNDAPIFNQIPSFNIDEDESQNNLLDLSPYVEDIDTPPLQLTYRIIGQTNATHYIAEQDMTDRSKIHVSPRTENWHGIVDVDVEVSDGEYTDQSTFRIHVEEVNDLPWVVIKDPMENKAIYEKEFSVVGEAHDVEGVKKVEVFFEGKWYEALGKNTWGVTLITPDVEEIKENVAIQAKVTDNENRESFAYLNITIFPQEEDVNEDLDGDGYKNWIDWFPRDPSEWMDSDGDGYGDNSDVFPFDPEWHSDRDKDGIDDIPDEWPTDPANKPLPPPTPKSNKPKTDFTFPIVLGIIGLLILVLAILTLIMFINKRSASLDPRRTVIYHNNMEKRKELFRKITGRNQLEKTLEKLQMKDIGKKKSALPYAPGPIPAQNMSRPGLPPIAPRGQPIPVRQLPPPSTGMRKMPPPPPVNRPQRR